VGVPTVGLEAIGYHLPPTRRTVEELHAAGQVAVPPEKLRFLGYDTVFVANGESTTDLAVSAVEDLARRSGFDISRVDAIVYGGGLGVSSMVDPGSGFDWARVKNPVPLVKFPASRLQAALGLPMVPTIGVAQLACNTFHACLRVARALVASEPATEHVLCVAADRFPAASDRLIVYNLMSDGACAAVVARNASRCRILAQTHITRGVYWDTEASHEQLVSAYFPLARQAVLDALTQAGITLGDLKLFVPQNVNRKSWDILRQILGLPPEKMFLANIPRLAHAVACDDVINLADVIDQGLVARGDKVALFGIGSGVHWGCIVLEV
jgi:3-oxoacyl-[acyl-carrier-protein] synthase-3